MYPKRTVDILYRSISQDDSMEADGAAFYRAWVGVNVTANEQKEAVVGRIGKEEVWDRKRD